MSRTADRVIPGAPHEVLLVLDATTGQNGLEQARKFTETSGVTGIVLTKLDGTAKGGVIVAIARELALPIRFIGVGEKVEDLLPFDPEAFIDSLFAGMSHWHAYMREALDLAGKGMALATPNPMVGAVIVQDGEVVGRGFHTWEGLKHAEILALEEAGRARSRGDRLRQRSSPARIPAARLRAPMRCIAAGIAKVVAASADPNPLVAGEGFRRLRASGVQVEIATDFQAEAEKLNEPFFHFMRTGRPLVTLKSALTLDGKIAAPEDNTGWITSERARAHVQELRHASDAIITGIGTALSDDPQLTDRSNLPRARRLLRVVLDSTLRLPLESRLVQTADNDLIVAGTSAASHGTPSRARKSRHRR